MLDQNERSHNKRARVRDFDDAPLAAFLHKVLTQRGIGQATLWLTVIVVAGTTSFTGLFYWLIDAPLQYILIGVALAFGMTAVTTPHLGRMSFKRMLQLYDANGALREAVARAEAADASKSKLLATVSHEIRSPLSGMLGLVELLQKRRNDENPDEHLAVLKETGEGMLRTLNDLLDHAKLEAGQMELDPDEVNLPRFLARTKLFWEGRAEEAGLHFELRLAPGTPERIHTDPHRLGQVLNNLISNALKFTEHGTITLSAGPAEDESGGGTSAFTLAVTDTGIGMDEAAQERVFTPFSQASAQTASTYGGTGLGLSICRSLTQLMGGHLSLESAPGKGTRVRLLLPLKSPQSGAPETRQGGRIRHV
jgi:signal transduction histidine kinase